MVDIDKEILEEANRIVEGMLNNPDPNISDFVTNTSPETLMRIALSSVVTNRTIQSMKGFVIIPK